MVVLDVHASPDKVFELLTRFSRYESFIPTVRSVNVYGTTEKTNSVSILFLSGKTLICIISCRSCLFIFQEPFSDLTPPFLFTGYILVVKILLKG